MNAPKAHRFLLSAVFLSFLGVSAAQAAKSNDYQPELDTKQIQPHTADEISNEPKAEGAKGQPDSAKTDSRAPATDASTDAMTQRNQDTTDSSKIDTSSSVKEGNESTTTERSQSNPDTSKKDDKITDSNETGTVHHNQSSPEFKRDKAKCEKLVGQSQDQCLLDLQKKYNMPKSK